MPQVSIIIPTYNEAKNLPLLVEEIFSYLNPAAIEGEIIIVDDNSPDGTGVVADELKKTYPINVIKRTGKLGLGGAVRAGFAVAKAPLIGVMDADLSHDPVILPEMIRALENYDLVLGSRFEEGSEVENWVWWRKLLSKIGVKIAFLLTGVKDPLSGYFFFKRQIIEGIELNTVGYKILLEILVKGKYSNVKEFAYKFRMRKFSTSKLNWKEYYLFLKQIATYSFHKMIRK